MKKEMRDIFRRAFNPTSEEQEADRLFLEKITQESINFWHSKGLNDQQIEILGKLEGQETSTLRTFESHSGRRSLIENNIITIQEVIHDIENFNKGV